MKQANLDWLFYLSICRFDSGVYLCIANNKVPPSVSKRVSIKCKEHLFLIENALGHDFFCKINSLIPLVLFPLNKYLKQ